MSCPNCSPVTQKSYVPASNNNNIPHTNNWTRATFIIDHEINEKIKALAYWERITVKEALHTALYTFLKDKHIPLIPNKK